jgi:hypothetical protein
MSSQRDHAVIVAGAGRLRRGRVALGKEAAPTREALVVVRGLRRRIDQLAILGASNVLDLCLVRRFEERPREQSRRQQR